MVEGPMEDESPEWTMRQPGGRWPTAEPRQGGAMVGMSGKTRETTDRGWDPGGSAELQRPSNTEGPGDWGEAEAMGAQSEAKVLADWAGARALEDWDEGRRKEEPAGAERVEGQSAAEGLEVCSAGRVTTDQCRAGGMQNNEDSELGRTSDNDELTSDHWQLYYNTNGSTPCCPVGCAAVPYIF